MSTTAVPPGVPKAPQGAIPQIGIPDSVDIPRLVFCAPYYTQVPLAELITPSVLEATEALLPSLIPPYIDDAVTAAVQQQAVLLTGSTMSGPLFLNGLPTQPSQAASMSYVDMMVSTGGVPEVPAVPIGETWARQTGQWVPAATGSAGVDSFNARTGAVTLTPADVSGATGLLTTGGTMSGGISFGSNTASGVTDFSHHITLWSPTAGISVTSANVNYVNGASGSHTFVQGSTTMAQFNSTGANAGLLLPMPITQSINIGRAPGTWTTIDAGTPGNDRWHLVLADNTAESGGNAGSNFLIQRFSDTAALIDVPFRITRSSGLVTIGAGGLQLTADPTAALQAATKQYVDAGTAAAEHNVGRNLVHNSLFNITQRGAGPFTTAGIYTLDRWWMQFQGGSMSTSQVALTDADRAAIGDEAATHAIQAIVTGGTGAAAYANFQHPIEDVHRTGGKTVTLSFWAKAAAGTPSLGVNWTQYFGAGGSPSATVNTNGVAVPIGTVWARYSVTTTLASVSGKIIGTAGGDCSYPNIWFSSGTTNAPQAGIGVQSGTFQLWGAQVEIGSAATPLEKPDPQQDNAKCQRFYQTGAIALQGNGGASVVEQAPIWLHTMRAAPTMIPTWTTQTNCGASGITQNEVHTTVTAGGQFVLAGSFTASADL